MYHGRLSQKNAITVAAVLLNLSNNLGMRGLGRGWGIICSPDGIPRRVVGNPSPLPMRRDFLTDSSGTSHCLLSLLSLSGMPQFWVMREKAWWLGAHLLLETNFCLACRLADSGLLGHTSPSTRRIQLRPFKKWAVFLHYGAPSSASLPVDIGNSHSVVHPYQDFIALKRGPKANRA